jgi:hypothetical protein
MRVNNIPISIMATALATSQLQAFVVPSVALAAWDDTTLGNSATLNRRIEPKTDNDTQTPSTSVTVKIQLTATSECGEVWVSNQYMTQDLRSQGFKLVTEGADAPKSLTDQGAIPVQPVVSDDGETIGFVVSHLLAGETAGIQYCLISEGNTTVQGSPGKTLVEWLGETESQTNALSHFGKLSMNTSNPESSQDSGANQGDNPEATSSPEETTGAVPENTPAATPQATVTPEVATQTPNGKNTTNVASGRSATQTDLLKTGVNPASQTVAVIVSSASVVSGLSVMVLRRLWRR